MREITARQKAVYNFLARSVQVSGIPPTLREIMEEFGLSSTNGVRVTLLALKKKGYVTEGEKGKARRFNPVMDRAISSDFRIPIIGRVSAGAPILAQENLLGHLSFGAETGVSSDSFVVIASDDSLCGAGIVAGDHVLIDPLAKRSSDDIVAVRRGESVILRKLGAECRLFTIGRTQEEDRESGPFEVCGKAVELIRKI